jgi:hypothetical protein
VPRVRALEGPDGDKEGDARAARLAEQVDRGVAVDGKGAGRAELGAASSCGAASSSPGAAASSRRVGPLPRGGVARAQARDDGGRADRDARVAGGLGDLGQKNLAARAADARDGR